MIEPRLYQPMLETVPSMTAALERCFRLAGLSSSEAAYAVGIDYCHFQRMFRPTGGRHFPPDLIESMMVVGHNKFPLHWLAHRMGEAVYPREMMMILDGIKECLTAEGRSALFALQQRYGQ